MTLKKPELTSVQKLSAWHILMECPQVFALGKYFYIGMKQPAYMPRRWEDIDCHLLGMLTEHSCELLSPLDKVFLECQILGGNYKEYRRSLARERML